MILNDRDVAPGSSSKGLYRTDITAVTPTAELIDDLAYTEVSYYMSNAQVIEGKVYFIDVWQVKNNVPTPASTGNLCVYDLSTNEVTVLSEKWY